MVFDGSILRTKASIILIKYSVMEKKSFSLAYTRVLFRCKCEYHVIYILFLVICVNSIMRTPVSCLATSQQSNTQKRTIQKKKNMTNVAIFCLIDNANIHRWRDWATKRARYLSLYHTL